MKKFRFKLETALNYRRSLEEREKERLAKAIQAVEAEEDRARQLNQEKQSYLDYRKTGGINLTDLQQQEAYLVLLDTRIHNQHLHLEKAQGNLNKHRHELTQAVSKRMVLERLKEKNLEEYRGELSRAEQRILDEVGIGAFSRRDEDYKNIDERR